MPGFHIVAVPGQSDVVAEVSLDTLNVVGTNGILVTTSAATDTVTLAPTYGTASSTVCQGNDSRLSDTRTPISHASTHKSAGTDVIRLDELAAPTDVTTLDASTSTHGLLRKGDGVATNFLNGTLAWSVPAGGGGATSAFGTITVSGQSDVVADAAPDTLTLSGSGGIAITTNATTDSVTFTPTFGTTTGTVCQGNDTRLADARTPISHAASHKSGGGDLIRLDEVGAPTDVTTLNASASAHGLLRKLSGAGREFINGNGLWFQPLGSIHDVKAYGAVGDGTADDTNAIITAIAAAVSEGGGSIFFPRGDYKTTSSISVNSSLITLVGVGMGAARIRPNFNGEYISLGAPSSALQSIIVKDIAISPSITATSAVAIIIRGNNINIFIDSVLITGCVEGIVIDSYGSGSVYRVTNTYIEYCSTSGIRVGNGNGYFQGLYMQRCQIAVCGYGIYLRDISGGYFSEIDIILCTNNAIYLFPSNGERVVFCFFATVLADSSTSHGWLFQTSGTGAIGHIQLTGSWAAGNGGNSGIRVNSTRADAITFCSCIFRGNIGHGLEVVAGGNILISACTVNGNGQPTPNTYSGVYICTGVSNVTIADSLFGNAGYEKFLGSGNTQKWGIVLETGTSNIIITGNNILGNMTAAINDATAGTKIIQNNLV